MTDRTSTGGLVQSDVRAVLDRLQPHARIVGAGLLAACLLSAYGDPASASPDPRLTPTAPRPAASATQNRWLAQATAFMARPEQQRELLTALRARAMTHPGFCPNATFAPKRINILFDPEAAFDASGAMTRGTIVQTFTMQGCSVPVLLTIQTEAAPGAPLRFIAALAGTSFAEPALQTKAIPYAVAAARPLVPGCASLAPVDTRLIGRSPDAGGTLVAWSEHWLMAGCGRLVNVKIHFTPDAAAKQVAIRADPKESALARMTGASGTAAGANAAPPPPPPAWGRIVASATGTSLIPPGGADMPGAKVAGTCLFKLRESAPLAPDHVECPSGLPPRQGASIRCAASRGRAQGRMDVAITSVAATSVTFACNVRAQ